jgi:phage repressor protein C with HTH and peptisase S24 domain
MAESYKTDRSPTNRRQDDFSNAFAQRLWAGLGGRKLKWLAQETGISTSMLSDYGKGGRVPGADKAVAIANALQVDLDWLLTGRTGGVGKQLAEPEDRMLREVILPGQATRVADDDEVEIDTIDLAYGMGGSFLDFFEDPEIEKARFSRAWLRKFTEAPPQLLFSAEGIGDSMWPTIHDRDTIIGDRSQRVIEQADKIWAVVYGGVGMIKRLRPMPDGSVKIMSDNPQVSDELATDGDLHIVGRVAAIVRRV